VGLAGILAVAIPATAAAKPPDIAWSGTINESHVWRSSDAVVHGFPCQGGLRWGIRTEWTIDASSARSASPPDSGNPGIATSYLVGPPEVGGIDAEGSLMCLGAIDPCIGVAVVPANVRTKVSGTEWSPRLTYDPASGRLAIDSPASPNPQGSVTGSVDQTTSYPPNTACSGGGGTTTVSGVGFPNRVNQGPQDLPAEDYRLQAAVGGDGKLHVQIPVGAPLEESGTHPYVSSGPRDGFSFNAFDHGGFIHAGSGAYERLDTHLSADLVGTCSDAAANLCGRLSTADARGHARRALLAKYRNRYANGRRKQLSCADKPGGTFKCPVNWKFKTMRRSTRFAGSVTVSGDPSDPETVLRIRARSRAA
jgi:hypothetical protein